MRQLILLMMILFAIVVSAGCLRGSYLKRGEQALAAGRYDEAEIFFRKEIQARPRSVQAHNDLATVLLQKGDLALAGSELAKALDLDPSNAPAELMQAQLLLATGQADQAEKRARALLTHDPRSLSAEVLLGDVLLAERKFDDASTQFGRSIADHPNSAAGYIGSAKVLMLQGQRDDALEKLDRATSAEPHRIDARLLKAKYLIGFNRASEAVAVVQNAIASDPGSSAAGLELGDALLAAQKKDEAFSIWRNLASKRGSEQAIACARLVLAELDSQQVKAAAADIQLVRDDWQRAQPDFEYARDRVLLSQGHYTQAVPLFVELTRKRPGFPPAFYYLGQAYLALGQYNDANDAFVTAERLAPNVVETQMMLAGLAFNRGEFPAAIAHSTRVLAHDESNLTAHLLMGDSLMAEKHPERAADEFRRAEQLYPDSPLVHARLGRLAVANKDQNHAIEEFEKALRLQPSLVDITEELTLVLWEAQGSKAALSRLRAQAQLQPKNPKFHLLLGTYLTRAGQSEEAIPEFRAALAEDPKLVVAHFALAQAYVQQGKTAEATKELEDALKHKPDYVPALMTLAEIFDRAGDRKRAISYYQRVLETNPDLALAANDLAWDYVAEDQNLDQALDLAQRARRLAPKDPHVADTLGFIMLKRGVAGAAIPLLRESVAALSGSEGPHYHLGLALLASNRPAEATSEFSTALKLGAKSAEADEITRALSRANEELRMQRRQKTNQPG